MAPVWMPLYVADYLGDTGHLSTVEHGAYLLLMMHYWQHGALPNDDRKLARICRMTPDEWADIRDTIAEFFDPGWVHKRIDAELEKAEDVISKRRAAGKAGASARYGKGKASAIANAKASAIANAKRSPKQTDQQTHQQTDSQSQSQSPSSPSNEGSEKDISFDFARWYAAYPRKEGKGQALKAYKAALKKVDAETLLEAAHDAAKRWESRERRYIPMPASWLNGERWLDETPDSEAPPDDGEEREQTTAEVVAEIERQYRDWGVL